MKVSRRSVIGTATAAAFAKPAGARRLAAGGAAAPPAPTITAITVAGSSTAASFPQSTPNADIGPVVVSTSDGSTATISLLGNSEGFHLSGTTSGSHLLAPAGGLAAGNYTDVVIQASGPYSNAPRTINPTLTAGALSLTINGSTTPAPTDNDTVRATLSGIPGGIGVNIYLTDAATLTSQFHQVRLTSAPSTMDCVIPLTQQDMFGNYVRVSPGNYAIAVFQVGSPSVPLITLSFTVAAAPAPPFPNINLQSWNLAVLNATPVLAGVGAQPQAFAVHGTVTFGVGRWQNTSGNPHPTNVTAQFTLTGDFNGSLTKQTQLIGGQVFDAAGSPSLSFDTTTIADGTYMLGIKIIDCADTSTMHWAPYQLLQYPVSILVMNVGPKAITGTYLIPTVSRNVNGEVNSTGIDAVKYIGLPIYNTTTPYPYPGPSLSPLVVPPVTDPASVYHSNPAGARIGSPVGYYSECSDNINLHEYTVMPMFQTTTAGGVFAGSWSGEGGDESIEGTYPVMAAQSWLDGPRNSHTSTGNTIIVATVDPRRTGGAGPFDAYHWTIINIGGNLSVRDLAGNMKTIAGYKRDLTKLPVDYLDSSVGEFPNTVLVGTLDTAPATSLSDFGGGANDCCWDPQNSNICYVAKTVDNCIMAVNFTATGPYGPTNPRIYRYAGYEGTAGYVDGPALGSVTGGVQNADGAKFGSVYSICIQRVAGISGHPIGTMYVADNTNCLIRKITQTSPGVAGTVSTLCGLRGGSVAPGATPGFITTITASATYSVTSIVELTGGNAAVVVAAPTPVTGVGWKVTIQVNGNNYNAGGSTFENNTYGIYTVSAFTDSQHFSLTMNPVPSSGTLTAIIWVADGYSAPAQVGFSAANAYTAFPQTVRMTAAGDIVFSEAWYNMMCRRIWLSGPNANTITRIMPFGNLAQVSGNGYGFQDIDDVGACGPVDDIMCFKTDANPGSAGYVSRIAIDGSGEFAFLGGDGGIQFPQEGHGGIGHYPWAFAFSKTQCRMIGAGKADTIFYTLRPGAPSDPSFGSYDAVIGQPGQRIYIQGTASFFPFLMRPSFAALFGNQGGGLLGQNVVPTIDDLAALYPNDYAPFSGSLAQFIQNGMGGKTLRPELSMNGSIPGRTLANLIYYLRRQSLPGSYPTITPSLFVGGDGVGAGALATLNTYSMDFIRPVVSGVSASRISSSSIQVSWTTDKATLGIICAGSNNSAATSYPYNMWTLPENDNAGGYGTSHTVTITNLPAAPTHYCVLVKDQAGNWGRSADAVVS